MGIGAAIGVGSIAAGLYSSNKQAKSADKAAKVAGDSAAAQYEIGMEQIELAREQWTLYKDKILPLEQEASRLGISAQELALKRGKDDYDLYSNYYRPMAAKLVTDTNEGLKPQYERARTLARQDVNTAFDAQEGAMQRNLQRRGASPTDGAYTNGVGDTSLRRAAVTSFAVNEATDRERARVEDTNFSRRATLLGYSPGAATASQGVNSGVSPNAAAYGLAQGANSIGNAGNAQSNMAQMYAGSAGNTMQGGINLATQAYDLYNRFSTPAVATPMASAPVTSWSGAGSSGNGIGAVSGGTSTWGYQPSAGFAEGGPVDTRLLQRDGGTGGVVSGPPGYDQVPAMVQGNDGRQYPAALTHGEYVIPTQATENIAAKLGRDWLDDLVEKYNSDEPRTTGARLRREG